MVLLIPIIAAGNLVPQRGRVAPWEIEAWRQTYPVLAKIVAASGLDHVYTSWWFLVVFTVFFLNMTLITWDLTRRTRIKTKGLHRFSQEGVAYFALGNFAYREHSVTAFEETLRKRRYRIVAAGEEVYAQKGWVGIWGGTILHIGLVVILIGAVLSGLSRFSGYTEMGDGQQFNDSAGSYLQSSSGILFPGHKPEIAIRVSNIHEKDLGKMKAVLSTLTVFENEMQIRSKTVRMNDPLYYKGMKIFQSRYAGPALLLVVNDPSGRGPLAGYVNLKQTIGKSTSSVFSLGSTPFQAKATYAPGSDSIQLELREKGSMVYEGTVRIGQEIPAKSWRISLAAINRWSGIIVVYDWAVPIIFSGFFLCVAGIAIMGLFDPREIWARKKMQESGPVVEILGWGRWRNMFLDEFRAITGDIPEWKS